MTQAITLTEDEAAELELLRRNDKEDTPGPWIQRAFDALAIAKGNAARTELLEGAIDQLLHVIDCGEPLFGDSRCQRCGVIHDALCDQVKPHQSRWCSGNTYEISLRELRAVARKAKP
jgi:hypothetical protein